MKWITNILKGILVTVSTMVPGVSGGTMAIILGIYDDLIHAISSFFEDWKKHSILMIQLLIGAVIGVLLFSRLIESALIKFPIIKSFFFIGVICGGIPTIYNKTKVNRRSKFNYVYLLVGFVIAILMSSEPEAVTTMATGGDNGSFLFLILAGFIIAIALILPGISGSFMLLMLGLYEITLNAINTLNIKFLIPLAIGGIIGTVATTKTIENLLNKYPHKTYMLILGFVIGSIKPIFPGIPTGMNIIYSILSLVIGFGIIHFISKRFSIK